MKHILFKIPESFNSIPIAGFDIVFTVIILTISFFFLTSILLAIHLVILKNQRKKSEERKVRLNEEISDCIALFMSEELAMQLASSKLKDLTGKEGWKMGVLIDIFLDLTNHFKGDQLSHIRQLFKACMLDQKVLLLAQHGHWYEKAKAVRLIGKMYIREGIPVLKKMSHERHPLLRSEVRASLTQLNDFSWMEKMSESDDYISDWEQLLIIEKLYKERQIQIPASIPMLTSNNPDLVCFGIRLSYLFNNFEAVPLLGRLLADHHESRVRQLALQALQFLGPYDAEAYLTEFLKTGEPLLVCHAIELLGNIGSDNAIKNITLFVNHEFTPLKLAAFKALKSNEFNLGQFQYLEDYSSILAHINDKKLDVA